MMQKKKKKKQEIEIKLTAKSLSGLEKRKRKINRFDRLLCVERNRIERNVMLRCKENRWKRYKKKRFESVFKAGAGWVGFWIVTCVCVL